MLTDALVRCAGGIEPTDNETALVTRLRTELGWKPVYTNFRDGLKATIEWYQANEAWWRPAKEATEKKYATLGR